MPKFTVRFAVEVAPDSGLQKVASTAATDVFSPGTPGARWLELRVEAEHEPHAVQQVAWAIEHLVRLGTSPFVHE
jgi:hypothetical protein